MKKIALTTLFIITATFIFAQNCNLVLFSEGGERFYLTLNGIQHNQTPETNVRVQALPEAPFKAKIVFEDNKISPIEKTLYTSNNEETTYSIRFMGDSKTGKELKRMGNSMIKTIGNSGTYDEKKKEYKIRMVSQTPISASNTNVSTTNVGSNQNTNVNSTTSSTTTTTTSNVNSNPNNASISMNVTVNDNGMNDNTNMGVNITDNTNYTESTTVTTTTTSGKGNTTHSNRGKRRCDYSMANSDFNDGKSSIESKTFADSKMTIAKQITKNNCPTAVQIRDYTKLFTFESGKLEYAKFAYDYCYDKGNFYKVNDAFEFESSIDDLNKHIGN